MIAGVIQARMASTRLPGKVLLEIAGEPLLAHQISRLRAARMLDVIAVATTVAPQDDAIAALCAREDVPVIRGSEVDVLSRYVAAAGALDAAVIVRLTADCPLIDPAVVDDVVTAFREANPPADLASNSLPPYTFPDGMDTEVVSRSALERASAEATDPADREHVTVFMWSHPELFKIVRVESPVDLSGVRLVVDHPADLEVIGAVLEAERRSGRMALDEILDFLEQHPSLRASNSSYARNAGWPESLRRKAAEHASGPRDEPRSAVEGG